MHSMRGVISTGDTSVSVLHVDDEPDFAEMTAEYLERKDSRFEVTTATDAQEALEFLGKGENEDSETNGEPTKSRDGADATEFDCVVSDYSMPGTDGIELLKEVREEYPDLPFILFTGKGSEEVASEAISAGVTDYLQKEPGTEQYTVLANRIQNAVNMRRSEQELRETSKQLRAVLDTVSAAVFMKDAEGRYMLMNQNCREMLGVEDDDVPGILDRDIFPDEVADELRDKDRKVLEEGKTVEFEEEIPTSEGERILLTLKSPIFDEDGEPYAVCCVSADITERRERETEFRHISKEYSTVFENVQDPMFLVNVEDEGEEFLFRRFNPAYEEKVGITEEDARGKTPHDVFGEEGSEIVERYRRCLEQGESISYEETLNVPAGERTYHTYLSPVEVEGEVSQIVGSARDITERKKRETELERYEAIVENTSDLVTLVEEDGTILYQSPSTRRVLGYDHEDAVGNNIFEYVHIEDRGYLMEEFSQLLEDSEHEVGDAEYRFEHLNGGTVWLSSSITDRTDTELDSFLIVSRDVTERKRREEELRSLKKRLDLAVEGANLGIWDRDIEAGEVTYNDQVLEIIGLPPEEAESDIEFWEERIHPGDLPRLKGGLKKHFKGETERYDIEFRMRTADGDWKWLRSMGQVVERGEDGRAKRTVGVHMDIDDRKEREKELERYETFVEKSSDVLTHVDEDGTVLYQSPAVEHVFGYEHGETFGDKVFEYAHPDDRERVVEEFYEIMNSPEKDSGELEFRVRASDGSYVWVEAIGTDHRETGTGGFIVNMREITERKEREQELERYESFIENSSDIITQLDEDGTILYQSPSVERILGHEQGERTGDNGFEYVHPEDREQAFEKFETLLDDSTKTIEDVEVRYERADGSYVWLEITGSDQRDTQSGGLLVNSREITERKEYEKELERSKDLLRRTEQIADTGGWEADLEAEEVRWTSGMYDVFDVPEGYEPTLEESIESYHPEDRDAIRLAIEDCREDGEPFNEELRMAGGDDVLWVHVRGEPIRENGEVTGIRGSVRDITEMKEREKELERSQDLLRKTERISDTGGWEIDLKTGEQRWTDGTYRIHGVSDDYEPTAEKGIEFYHPDDREVISDAVERCREDGEPYDEELRFITADGELRWIRASGEPVYEGGDIVMLRGSIRDITEEKERETELLRNNMAVRELYEITADPDLSFEDKIEMVLESCRSRLGLPYAFVTEIDTEAETQTVKYARGTHELLQPGESCPLQKSYCRKTLKKDSLLAVQNSLEDGWKGDEAYELFELGSYIGAKLTVGDELYGTLCFASNEPRAEPFTEFERTLVELMANWVSYELERKRSEDRLRRQKERLDDFASVVSHDLRSPLTVLMGNLELAEETGNPDHFDSCRDAVERMEAIIDDLLSLARDVDDTGEIEPVDVGDMVEECWRNIETKDTKIRVESENVVMADRGKLRQMFENLLRNSVEHGGGGVTVTVSDLPDGFRLEDNGSGIPEEERDRVFEPGYTTDEGGTGLGMYIVKQVAEVHGWSVEATEGEKGGAAFEVTGVEKV